MPKSLRILVVNQYYPPDTSATAAVFEDLVEAMIAGGHEVTVVCGRPSYDPTERRPPGLLIRERSGGAFVQRLGSTTFDRRILAGRISNYLSFMVLAAVRVTVRRRPDVVVVGSDPPIAVWVGLLAARGRPVIYSLRDLHPEFAIASGMIRSGRITALWDRLHTRAMSCCSLIVCLGPKMEERVRQKGVSPEVIRVVPDGAPAPWGAPEPEVVAELRGSSEFVTMHAGNLGGAGAWHTLIKAADFLGGAGMVFVGDGAEAEQLRRVGAAVVPFRPAEQLASVMAAGDLQVVTLRRGMEGLVVPSKLYTILAHGRPVLAVAPEESEVARIVREHGCGLVADPDDPAEVAERIAWASASPAALEEMGTRSRLAWEGLRREQHLDHFVSLVEETAQDGRPPA